MKSAVLKKGKRGGARPGAGKPPYEPTPTDRATVKNLVVCGYTHAQIAQCLGTEGIGEKTLRKHFRRELDTSKSEVDAFATSSLVGLMKQGNLGAICFYLKCRSGWRQPEPTQRSVVVIKSPKDMTTEELSAWAAELDSDPDRGGACGDDPEGRENGDQVEN